jgi:hypothetical protein
MDIGRCHLGKNMKRGERKRKEEKEKDKGGKCKRGNIKLEGCKRSKFWHFLG